MGFDEAAFWARTPRQVVRVFRAQEKIHAQRHNERAWLAWHIAVLGRIDGRKMPKLDRMMVAGAKAPQKQQTPEQMILIAKMITVAMGGSLKTKH